MITVPYQNTSFYSTLIKNYFNGKLLEEGKVNWAYDLEQIQKNATARKFEHREILVDVLTCQSESYDITPKTAENIALLKQNNCFTICTGHQLSLFGGPAFFFSKIVDCIKLSNELSQLDSTNNFVPVFWLASEDHDFEEISNFKIFGKTLNWKQEENGATGRMNLKGVDPLLEELSVILGENGTQLKSKIVAAYKKSKSLVEATTRLVYDFLGSHGVIVINADEPKLKSLSISFFEKELLDQVVQSEVSAQIQKLGINKAQASPREINLFYLSDQERTRIVKTGDNYELFDKSKTWSETEIISELNQNPQKFSPNVLMRPIYQEIILPNVAYLGGAGEIAYWLELPMLFEKLNVNMPLPIVRNSYFFVPENKIKKIQALGLAPADLFLSKKEITDKILSNNQDLDGIFESFDQKLEEFYKFIADKLPIKGQECEKIIQGDQKRAEKSLEQVKNRLKNLAKRDFSDKTNVVEGILQQLFPEDKAQERTVSIFETTLKARENVLELMYQHSAPLKKDLTLISY